ncbi:Arfaptin-1 [Manis pentadactyla]|nr:Arfaptin-1 [Manis pentadactyla]
MEDGLERPLGWPPLHPDPIEAQGPGAGQLACSGAFWGALCLQRPCLCPIPPSSLPRKEPEPVAAPRLATEGPPDPIPVGGAPAETSVSVCRICSVQTSSGGFSASSSFQKKRTK